MMCIINWQLMSLHKKMARAFADQRHRTLGAMQDQEVTDAAVSAAHSIDHVDSSWSTGGDEPASTSVLPNASPPARPRRLTCPAPALLVTLLPGSGRPHSDQSHHWHPP